MAASALAKVPQGLPPASQALTPSARLAAVRQDSARTAPIGHSALSAEFLKNFMGAEEKLFQKNKVKQGLFATMG
jgi:hypothetical protein